MGFGKGYVVDVFIIDIDSGEGWWGDRGVLDANFAFPVSIRALRISYEALNGDLVAT